MTKKTKKHFELFKSECEKWIKIFQLNNWRFEFFIDNEDDKNRVYQLRRWRIKSIDMYFCSRSSLSKDIQKVKQTAKHEIIHSMLGGLVLLGEQRYLREDELYEEEEGLVRKLEKLIN